MTEGALIALIVALITSIFGPIIVDWFKKEFFNKKDEDPVKEAIKFGEKIEQQITHIMENVGCNRIWISQFHNGGYFYPTGKSIQKFSIFYERTLEDIHPIKEVYQNIPVSLFPKLLSKLYHDGEVYFDQGESNDLFSLSKDNKSVFSYNTAISDLENRFIGILSMSFDRKKEDLTEEEWDFIKEKSGVIGTILSESSKR